MLVIEGMENCIIKDNVNIKISGYENIIREIRLKEIETGKAELEIYFIEKYFKNKSYDEIRCMTFKIAKLLVDDLLDKGFSFSHIKFDKYRISTTGAGKASATGEITITCIDTEVKSQVLDIKELNLDASKEISDIIGSLEGQNSVQRYENLYEQLKKKCGSQVKVTEKIKNEFADEFNIKCDNLNIDSEYAKKHKYAEKQDDFTYLRTMISHGNIEYADEIEQRLERDTIKIVKVLKKIEKVDLSDNKLLTLPVGMKKLHNLKHLNSNT